MNPFEGRAWIGMHSVRLYLAAVLLLLCVAAAGAWAEEPVSYSGPPETQPYISKEVVVLLEEELAALTERISPGYLATYGTEELAYPFLQEIVEAQRLSAKMELMVIQQNNEIIRLLQRLVEEGRFGADTAGERVEPHDAQ